MENTKICPHCGSLLDIRDRVCRNCGWQQPIQEVPLKAPVYQSGPGIGFVPPSQQPRVPVQSVSQPMQLSWQQPACPTEKPKRSALPAVIAVLVVLLALAVLGIGVLLIIQPYHNTVKSLKDGHVDLPMPTSMTDSHLVSAETATVPAETAVRKVALLTDSTMENSYDQPCLKGVADWAEERQIPYIHIGAADDSNEARVAAVHEAVAKGVDTIVMSGYLFGSTLPVVMDKYPDVKFIAVDVCSADMTPDYVTYYDPSKNVTLLTFAEEEAGYMAGYAAVKDGYTKLGFVGGMAVPAVIRYGYGFVQGADAAAVEMGKDVEIKYTYAGIFYGSPEVTQSMNSWYQSGTEIVFACGGGIYTSVVEAAERNGGKVIGVDVDQSDVSSDMVTSAVKNMELAAETLLEAVNRGEWDMYGGVEHHFTLEEGDYLCLPTEKGSWRFNTFSTAEYEAVRRKIANGQVMVNNDTGREPWVSGNTTVYYLG